MTLKQFTEKIESANAEDQQGYVIAGVFVGAIFTFVLLAMAKTFGVL
jgi:hypothetical protein